MSLFFYYICFMELEINNKKYPIFFNMTAIENVMVASEMEDFSAFGKNQGVMKSLKFTRDVAYYGIKSGCKKQGVEMPFESSEDLGDEIESFEQLAPAVELFMKAVGDFFQVKESKVKTPKKTTSH
jgi:hypothetical protein